jgi:HAD superfamily hydrolase (TIGR01509 family)
MAAPIQPTPARILAAVIFDVDGVIVASPHERAWREALTGITDPARLTTAIYQTHVAGKPRMDGARAVLAQLGIADPGGLAERYADAKQKLVETLIEAGDFAAFPDAQNFAAAAKAKGLRLALASSSKNAASMLKRIAMPDGQALLALFDADLSGIDLPHGKPDPEIFLRAAAALGVAPAHCLVVEDAPAGIEAGVAGGMATLAVARLDDQAQLRVAGADLVVTSLDDVDTGTLLEAPPRARARATMLDTLTPAREAGWSLVEEGYDIRRENSVEARFAISNGFLGARASRSVSRAAIWVSWLGWQTWTSWPRTYVAGLFDRPDTDPPVPALVPVADWSRVRVHLNGETVLLRSGETLAHRRTLDMRRGLLIADWSQRTPAGTVMRVRTARLVSLADRAIGLQLLRIEIDGPPSEVTLEASFEGAGQGMETLRLEQDLGIWRTAGAGRVLAMAGTARLAVAGGECLPSTPVPLTWRWTWTSAPGEAACLTRIVAVTRADAPDDGPARRALSRATFIGWRGVLAAHEAYWSARWSDSDVVVTGDEAAEQALRFAVYHLNSAVNPDDPLVSIGARALTGDVYLGHVFWDTEIYLLPFYTLTWPEAARALLMYRYNTLPGARAKAAAGGWRGAMYAWESADTGEETTPDRVRAADGKLVDVLSGRLEQHITADVAFAVWRYWRATGDDTFLREAGAEIMLDTARFWCSRARLESDGHRHIRDVVGPDEYHEHVDDNAYTNVLARWNLRRGIETAEWLREHYPARWAALTEQLGLEDAELAEWSAAADTLVTGFDEATGLFEQFTGYFSLEDIDLAGYADRTMPMDVVLGREHVQRSQIVKQADVVALLALGVEEFPPSVQRANFDYYEPRCGHGSSLSRALHAMAAARLGDAAMALRYFQDSTALDLSDATAGASGGVHIAALGGLWQAAVFGFAGLSFGSDVLRFDPMLPESWRELRFAVYWRGAKIRVRIGVSPGRFDAVLVDGPPTRLIVRGEEYGLRYGEVLRVGLT